MSSTSTVDPRSTIRDRVQRIADFVRPQVDLTHVVYVWEGEQQIVAQALPDADAALAMLREAVRRRQASIASDQGRARMSSTSARLVRLESQVRTCVRALQKSGVEFVLAWQIAGQLPEIVFDAGSTRPHVVRDVMTALERAQRSDSKSASPISGSRVLSQW